jgi:hypothetical protein
VRAAPLMSQAVNLIWRESVGIKAQRPLSDATILLHQRSPQRRVVRGGRFGGQVRCVSAFRRAMRGASAYDGLTARSLDFATDGIGLVAIGGIYRHACGS